MVTMDTFQTNIVNVRAQGPISFDGKILFYFTRQRNLDRHHGVQYYRETLLVDKCFLTEFKTVNQKVSNKNIQRRTGIFVF